jgi:hypothetical protein
MDKDFFRMAALEGLESFVCNQLHVKQHIDHALIRSSRSYLDPNTHTLTPGDTNQLLR